MLENLTIITPTYNRANTLSKLYRSLLEQTNKNFLWLIIDDGSNDDTKEIVKKLIEEKKINIIYKFKENGGKHTALNYAFNYIETPLTTIVDSDDSLEKNAVKQIEEYWEKYKNNEQICGLVFKKKKNNGNMVSQNFKADVFVDNYNKYVINKQVKGDKAEVFRSDILKKYRYPVFKNEKFMGEGVLWSKIAEKYNMVFINKAIYICEYLDRRINKTRKKN